MGIFSTIRKGKTKTARLFLLKMYIAKFNSQYKKRMETLKRMESGTRWASESMEQWIKESKTDYNAFMNRVAEKMSAGKQEEQKQENSKPKA